MNNFVEIVERARASGDFSLLTAVIPYAQFLGITTEIHESELVCKLEFSHHLVGNPALPALHGGTIGALLESTAIFQVLFEAETVVLPKTINVTVAYLRSGKPMATFAKGVVTKHGRRVASVRVEAWQENILLPIASATVHLLIDSVAE